MCGRWQTPTVAQSLAGIRLEAHYEKRRAGERSGFADLLKKTAAFNLTICFLLICLRFRSQKAQIVRLGISKKEYNYSFLETPNLTIVSFLLQKHKQFNEHRIVMLKSSTDNRDNALRRIFIFLLEVLPIPSALM